jgi:amino acid transporter
VALRFPIPERENILSENSPQPAGRLRGNAIGALGAAVISMAFMGPATSVVFNTPAAAAKIGYALPVGVLLSMVACLITASAIAAFARKLPSAGFAYTFNTHAYGKGAGFVSGWTLALVYGVVGPMVVAAMGVYGNKLFVDQFGWDVPWWVISAVVLVALWWIGSRGISQSVKAALIFLVLELVVILTLAFTVIGKGGAEGNSLAPFDPGNSLGGFGGIGFAMLWGILMFVGFESAGTLGEETRNPRRSVPFALFAAVIMIGIMYVVAWYAAAVGFGPGAVQDLAASGDPFSALSDTYWGKEVAWILTLTVLNSQFANVLSGSTGAVRILFALSREGILPRRLASTDERNSPVAAWAAYAVLTGIVALTLGAVIGPLETYFFLGGVLGLGIIVLYISMNIGLIRYFWVHHRAEWSPIRHGLLPIVGSVLMLLPIYGQVWPIPDWPYRVVPYLIAAWIVAGAVYFGFLRSRRPGLVEGMGRVWEPDNAPVPADEPQHAGR